MMKLLIAGGGTGGHLFPGVAVSKLLLKRSPDSKILFVGSPKELDQDLILKENFDFQPISQKPYPPSFFSLKSLQFTVNSFISFLQAVPLVYRFQPDVVLGMGGYSSVPTVLAARLLRIPAVLFEPNLYPGKANLFLAPFVSKIALGFDQEKEFFKPSKVIRTGIPVREGIIEAVSKSNSKKDSLTLLVMGGSRGAKALNKIMVETYSLLKERFPQLKCVHLTGRDSYQAVKESYLKQNCGKEIEVYPFVKDMEQILSRTNVVLARAGASSLAEFAVLGIPAILVPYPHSAQDHQVCNARFFENRGAAKVILERELTPERWIESLSDCLENPEKLNQMGQAATQLGSKQAAESLLQLIEESQR